MKAKIIAVHRWAGFARESFPNWLGCGINSRQEFCQEIPAPSVDEFAKIYN